MRQSYQTRKLSSIEDRGRTDRVLTLTYDLQFQSSASHGSDPHISKRSRPKVSRLERQSGNRRMDRQTDGGDCVVNLPC